MLCAKLAASISKRKQDAAIECGICYEKVLSKRERSARRFGLMACDHAFCLGCIRNWRSTAEVDKDTALRTCPICRTSTYFITPSTSWPDTPADKEAIVTAYKAALSQKDCTHFAYGEGTCPFGTSCFYRHAFKDGRLEEVQLRRAANNEGEVKVLAPVKLSSFLEASITAQRALTHRPAQQQQNQPRFSHSGRGGGYAGGFAAVAVAAAVAEEQTAQQQQHEAEQGHADAEADADIQQLQQRVADVDISD